MKSDGDVIGEAAKCGNERIREEVRRMREVRAVHSRSRHQDEIALSSADRSFFTISSRRHAARHVVLTVGRLPLFYH